MRVVLISGLPNQGKTFAADHLRQLGHADVVLHTDELYCDFISAKYPELMVCDLHKRVKSHFVSHRQSIEQSWKDWLLQRVAQAANSCATLVVEGWHVGDAADSLTAVISQQGGCAIHVVAKNKRYYVGTSELQLEELATCQGTR